MITIPIGFAIANKINLTIHRALSINSWTQVEKQDMPKCPWQNHFALILNKLNIISLNLISLINMQLSQTKGKISKDTIILDSLTLVIVIGDFYQFLSIVERLL